MNTIKLILIISSGFILTSCGTSETIMKDRFSALPTSVLCQKLVDGTLASWQEK